MGRIMQFLPGSVVHCVAVLANCVGLKGFGVAVVIDQSCRDLVSLYRINEDIQTVWLRCSKTLFGLTEDVLLAASYMKPQSKEFPAAAVVEQFTHLYDDVLDAVQESPNLLLCGDYNACVGTLKDVGDEHFDFLVRFPGVFEPRQCRCPRVNKAGQLLVDLAASVNCVVTTGRVQGDCGQASFVGYNQNKNSRPDHILLSPDLFSLVDNVHVHMSGCALYDHNCISMNFRVPRVPGVDMGLECGHVCGAGNCLVKQCLHWKHDVQHVYVQHILDNSQLQREFCEAVGDQDVERACSRFCSLITEAAAEAGMGGAEKCLLNRKKRMSLKRPLWSNGLMRSVRPGSVHLNKLLRVGRPSMRVLL